MLREELNEALKTAMKARDQRAVSTLRLILAAIKDRDIAARGQGNAEGISEDDVLKVLTTMVRQRKDSIEMYQKGDRPDLVEQETEETEIIRRFLPEQMDPDATAAAIDQALADTGAGGLKEMGQVMAHLRQLYAGRMDFAEAGKTVKQKLGGG